nr:NAD(P)/FAD-dependent oxidoreductase [Clostridia bacterium]
FYTGKKVCMVGGGNSALQEAILLSDKCSEVMVLQDLPFYTGEQSLQDILFSRSNVSGLTGVKVTRLLTENGQFRGVEIVQNEGAPQQIFCDGLFVAIGLIPENDLYKDLVQLDEFGYFDTDEMCLTRTPGVFVAGDCRKKRLRQLTTAVSDGATAAMAAVHYINALR